MKKDTERIEALEQAVLELALHIERCPYNEYKVSDEVMNLMGYEPLSVSKESSTKK